MASNIATPAPDVKAWLQFGEGVGPFQTVSVPVARAAGLLASRSNDRGNLALQVKTDKGWRRVRPGPRPGQYHIILDGARVGVTIQHTEKDS